MLAVSAGVRHVGVTNDYRTLFDDDNPQLAALVAFENTYGASNVVMIAVAPKAGTVFTTRTLGAIEELTEAAWGLPYSTRVDSLTNHSHSEGRQDELIVGPLVEDATALESAQLERIRRIALSTPELVGRLVSPDGRVGGLVVRFALPGERDAAVLEITENVDGILDRIGERHPDTEFLVTGDVPLNRSFSEATLEDLRTRAPAVAVIIVLAATAMLGSAVGAAAIVAVIAFVAATTLGFAGWLRTVFNPASSGVPIMVTTIAVANSVHIVSTALSEMRRGLDRNSAITESIRINAWPVFLASLTTAIGFLSLNSSDSPPLRVLGSLVAFGVMCAFVYSMTLLPALLSILPLRGATGPQRSSGVLRTAWRNRRFEQEDPALVHLHRCRCPGRRHSEDRVFRQLDDLFERTLPIPPGHRFHHGKPDGIGNPRILAECRRRRGRHRSGLFEEGRCLRRMVPGAAGGQTRPGLPRHHEAPQQEHARGRSGPPRNPG